MNKKRGKATKKNRDFSRKHERERDGKIKQKARRLGMKAEKEDTWSNTWSNQQRWKCDAAIPKKPTNWTHVKLLGMGTIGFSLYFSFII